MREALAAHDALFREIVPARRGAIFKTVGDAICAAFERAEDALFAAVDAQRRLTAHAWPAETGEIRVRMGLHTGTAQERDDDYFGRTVNRVARLMSIAHGGQILVSGTTARLLQASDLREFELRDLGSHRLKDLAEPEPTFQVIADGLRIDFPALASLDAHPNNLPSQTSTFVGRSQELSALLAALERNRLITITGPGGIGKTRLSQQLGADGIDQFKDGVWFMELAALTESALLAGTISDVLHVREIPQEPVLETLLHTLSRKKALLILDNCEHLLTDVAAFAKEVLARSPPSASWRRAVNRCTLRGNTSIRSCRFPSTIPPRPRVTPSRFSSIAPDPLEKRLRLLPQTSLRRPRFPNVSPPTTRNRARCRARRHALAVRAQYTPLAAFPSPRIAGRTLSARHRTLRQTVDWSYQLLNAGGAGVRCRARDLPKLVYARRVRGDSSPWRRDAGPP